MRNEPTGATPPLAWDEGELDFGSQELLAEAECDRLIREGRFAQALETASRAGADLSSSRGLGLRLCALFLVRGRISEAMELVRRFEFGSEFVQAAEAGGLLDPAPSRASLAPLVELTERHVGSALAWMMRIVALNARGERDAAERTIWTAVGKVDDKASFAEFLALQVARPDGSCDFALAQQLLSSMMDAVGKDHVLGLGLARLCSKASLRLYASAGTQSGEAASQLAASAICFLSRHGATRAALELADTFDAVFGANPAGAWARAACLVEARQWADLRDHLGECKRVVSGVYLTTEQALTFHDAIWRCRLLGHTPLLDHGDVMCGDSRLAGALDAYRCGNPFILADEEPRDFDSVSRVRYVRIYSFSHRAWLGPPGGFETGEIGPLFLDAVAAGRPYSLIRLGDGEANLLDDKLPTVLGATFFVDEANRLQAPRLDVDEYDRLKQRFRDALANCDVLGIPNEFTAAVSPEMTSVYRHVRLNQSPGCIYTDNAVHYALGIGGWLERAMAIQLIKGGRIVYIGPHAPAAFAKLLIPSRLIENLLIPPELAYFAERIQSRPHYPDFYEKNLATLRQLPQSSLVLISAGPLGKIYADEAKRSGSMGIDIGALSDHWAGHKTRIYAQNGGEVSSPFATLEALLERAE